ncbi:MAG: alpha/beta hydrolase [Actinobacteria bacterium]|nr:alpha/beta hydrolase [Actinomycetota bacterium]
MEKEINFYSSGVKLNGIISIPEKIQHNKVPAVVFSHGYGSGRDELGSYILISEHLNKIGFTTFRFDMRGSGYSKYTPGKKLCSTEWKEDLKSAVYFISSYPGIDDNRVGVIGESMGAAIVIQTAAECSKIKCIIALAPIADGYDLIKQNWVANRCEKDYRNFLEELEEDRIRRTKYESSNLVKLSYALAYNKNSTEIVDSIKEIVDDKLFSYYVRYESVDSLIDLKPINFIEEIAPRPILILAGMKDDIVPYDRHAKLLFRKAKEKKKIILFEEGDHLLLKGSLKEEVLSIIKKWFVRYL